MGPEIIKGPDTARRVINSGPKSARPISLCNNHIARPISRGLDQILWTGSIASTILSTSELMRVTALLSSNPATATSSVCL